jgi:hypothetical protein
MPVMQQLRLDPTPLPQQDTSGAAPPIEMLSDRLHGSYLALSR